LYLKPYPEVVEVSPYRRRKRKDIGAGANDEEVCEKGSVSVDADSVIVRAHTRLGKHQLQQSPGPIRHIPLPTLVLQTACHRIFPDSTLAHCPLFPAFSYPWPPPESFAAH
jgi:hypothetical protein